MRIRLGFTMIELLIYMAITAIALVVFTSFMADTTANAARARQGQDIQQTARLIFNRLSQEVRQAQTLSIGTCSGNPSLVAGADTFCYDGSSLTLAGQSIIDTNKIAVDQFTPTATGNGVNVALKLSTTGGTPPQTIQFSTTLFPHQSFYQ